MAIGPVRKRPPFLVRPKDPTVGLCLGYHCTHTVGYEGVFGSNMAEKLVTLLIPPVSLRYYIL